jgi:hypothetical protein
VSLRDKPLENIFPGDFLLLLMRAARRPRGLAAKFGGRKRRMQGKACFKFTAVDQELFSELARLTEAGIRNLKA